MPGTDPAPHGKMGLAGTGPGAQNSSAHNQQRRAADPAVAAETTGAKPEGEMMSDTPHEPRPGTEDETGKPGDSAAAPSPAPAGALPPAGPAAAPETTLRPTPGRADAAADERADAVPAIASTTGARRGVRRIALLALALLAAVVAWTVLADRHAPGTSRGAISAYVAQIAPRVPGRVTEVLVADNAIVEPGAPLFAVDERPYEIAVERARVQLEQATQAIQASSAQLASAQAQVAKARAAAELANDAAARTRTLHERGIVAKARLDADENTANQANAALEAAEASAESARAQLGSTGIDNTQIRAAELALEQAQYDLISTTVTAPRPGVVTNLRLTPGQFAAAGTPVMTFIDADAVWIIADLRENQLVNVDPGDKVTIAFDADPGHIYAGTVESIAWGINPGRNEAGGLPVNAPSTQWFEPARRMPVRITVDGGIDAFPKKARLGGKVSVVIHASGASPVAAIAGLGQRIGSYLSALY